MDNSSRNVCVEKNALDHASSSHFIYTLPRPSGLYLHVFPVAILKELYRAKSIVGRSDGTLYEKDTYEHIIVGDQPDNYAVLPPNGHHGKSRGELPTKLVTTGIPSYDWNRFHGQVNRC